MGKYLGLSAVLFACLSAPAARADESAMTAGDLQAICMGTDAETKAACRFYILGISQGIDIGLEMADGKVSGGRACVPADTSSSTLEMAVKMKLGEDLMMFPDDRKIDASGFVGAVLLKTFPCRK